MQSRSRVPAIMAAALAAVLFLAGAGSAAAQQKIVVVNLDYIVANAPAGKGLQAKLEKFQEEARAEVASKQEAAKAIRQRIADGVNSLSEDKLAEMQQEFEAAQLAVKQLQENKQREGRKMQEEGLKEIEQQLGPIFEQVRDEGGYDLILNNVPGVVLMVGEGVDITQEVVDKLGSGSEGG